MSGRFNFPPPSPISVSPAKADKSRLAVALAVSLLLHGSLMLAPMLGTSREANPPLVSRLARLSARLTTASTGVRSIGTGVAEHQEKRDSAPTGVHRPKTMDDKELPPGVSTEGADVLPLPGPVYFASKQLTKRPQVLNELRMEGPESIPAGASGKMTLTLWISASGSVAKVVVDGSELPEEISRLVTTAFEGLQFTPGEIDGQPVGAILKVEANYDDIRLPPP